MRKQLLILLFILFLISLAVVTTEAQRTQPTSEIDGHEKSQDSEKPDVPLKIKSKPKV